MHAKTRWLIGFFSLLFLVIGAAGIASGSTKNAKSPDPRFTGGINDPRSGAAINRDSALNPEPSPQALFPADPRQFIYATAVNDPSADTTAQDTQSETTVAARGNKVVTAFNDSGSYGGSSNHFTGFASSTNTGGTFTDRGTLPASTNGDAGDPILAPDDSGNVYMSTLGLNTNETIQVFKSTNGGQSFGAPVNATPEFAGTGDFLDKAWIAVNNLPGSFSGEIAVCYTDFTSGGGEQIRLSESIDGGASWFPSVLVNDGGQGCNLVWGKDQSGGGNTLYAFYYEGTGGGGQGGDNKLFVNTYNESGASPHGPITGSSAKNLPAKSHVMVADLNTTTVNGDLQLNGGLRTNSFPQAAVNPVNGHVIVTYNDDTTPTNADIYRVTSKDGGGTWTSPAKVNDDTARDQFFPSVAIAPDGKNIMFSYYSRSHDPGNGLFHRQGRTGLVNTKTSSLTMRPSFTMGFDTPVVIGQDPVINSTYMGDYDQTVADGGYFHSTWSDNRDGNTFHQYQPDVRYSRISTPATDTDLSVSVTPTATVPAGSTTTMTVKVTASGGPASDAWVSLSPVTGLTYTGVTGPGCSLVQGFVNCRLSSVADGTTKTVKVDAFAGLPAGTRTVKAVATTSSHDLNTANDTGTATLTVTGSGTTNTYSSGNIAVPIPDAGMVEVPVAVPNVGNVLKAQAVVRLNHTFDSDLRLSLVSPGGTVVLLSNRRGGAGDNYGSGTNNCAGTPTTFTDSAATPISAGVAPFAGSFKPDSPLAGMNGTPTGGNWKLRVEDLASLDVGTIGCFKVKLTHP